MKHRKNRIIRKEDDSLRMVPTGIQKYFLSSVLKALALEVVTVGLLSQPSYNPRSSRDDATHRSWSVCALLISECVAHPQCSFERHCCQLCMFSPTITCQNMAEVRHESGFCIDTDWMRTLSKKMKTWSQWSKARDVLLYMGASSSIGSSSALRKRAPWTWL